MRRTKRKKTKRKKLKSLPRLPYHQPQVTNNVVGQPTYTSLDTIYTRRRRQLQIQLAQAMATGNDNEAMRLQTNLENLQRY